MTRAQFIVSLFLISLKKNGAPIPQTLPPALKSFISNYKESVPPQNGGEKKGEDPKNKVEGMMNLLLKSMFDQEVKLLEYQNIQQSCLQNEEKEQEYLQDVFQRIIEEEK